MSLGSPARDAHSLCKTMRAMSKGRSTRRACARQCAAFQRVGEKLCSGECLQKYKASRKIAVPFEIAAVALRRLGASRCHSGLQFKGILIEVAAVVLGSAPGLRQTLFCQLCLSTFHPGYGFARKCGIAASGTQAGQRQPVQ